MQRPRYRTNDAEMRFLEYFHNYRAPDGLPLIIRLDGRSFHKFTKDFAKPVDVDFQQRMGAIATMLIDEFDGIFVETHSDEISVLVPDTFNQFGRKVEKIVSTTASYASSAMTMFYGKIVTFDSRIVLPLSQENIIKYFLWRRSDSVRNSLNMTAYTVLIQDRGLSPREATNILNELNAKDRINILKDAGIDFDKLPDEDRQGICAYKVLYDKQGYNPKTNESVTVQRNGVRCAAVPKNTGDYIDLLRSVMEVKND